MKIALVHSRLLRKGGLETRLFSYMEFLNREGHDVSVIVHKVGRGETVPDGVRVIHTSLKPIPKPFRAPLFDRRLLKVRKKYDFDFVLSLTKTSHQDAVLAPGNHIGFLTAIDKRHWTVIDRMLIRLEQKAFDTTPVILAASHMMKEELIRFYKTDSDKIYVLSPPVDEKRFHLGLRQQAETFRQKHGLPLDKKLFLLVSSSHGRKGLPILLEVFSRVQDQPVHLVVAGAGGVHSDLPNVTDLGFTPETEELYAAADFSVLPAKYEPFGQVVPESILCGTPVLVSHMVGAKGVVTEAEGVIVESLEPDRWYQAILGALPRSFDIKPGFAQKNRIRLEDHMGEILKFAHQKVDTTN